MHHDDAAEAFLKALRTIRQHKKDGRRAVHKPIVLLYALARVSRGEERLVRYGEAMEPLTRLLTEFGPTPRSNVYHTEYPFVRLQNDRIWETRLESGSKFVAEGDPSPRRLVDLGVEGGFPPDIHQMLAERPEVLREAVTFLLEDNFTDTLHEEILSEIGLGLNRVGSWVLRSRRDPAFRAKVLLAYEYRCAVCGFHLQMHHAPVGLDAAHIRWKQERGPDVESNGLALCTLHHRLFDRGAFTVLPDGGLAVSRHAVGESLEPCLLRFRGAPIRPPQEAAFAPDPAHLGWHEREVFRAPARGVA